MSFGATLVAIVAIIAWAVTRSARHRRHDGWEGERAVGADPAYTAELEREVANLRKRLEVLERIATDGQETRRLAQEIESLRDR